MLPNSWSKICFSQSKIILLYGLLDVLKDKPLLGLSLAVVNPSGQTLSLLQAGRI